MKKNPPPPPKCLPLSFPILGGRDSTRDLQSSPVQILGGGSTSVMDGRTDGQTNERRKSLSLILDVTSFTDYEDDIFEDISNWHFQEFKFGGKNNKFGRKSF